MDYLWFIWYVTWRFGLVLILAWLLILTGIAMQGEKDCLQSGYPDFKLDYTGNVYCIKGEEVVEL